jgi:hypothetical protein
MWRTVLSPIAILDDHLGPEGAQHALGVVAGGFGLDHLDAALGVQAGQQHGRLHLGRGHRQLVGQAAQVAALQGQGQAALVAAQPGGAHAGQRIQHPAHRPAAQGIVAGEGGAQREARRRAHDQPHAGAGVAAVDHVRRLDEAALALDPPAADAFLLDPRAERCAWPGRWPDVGALQQALDRRGPGGQGAQDHRAVRNRLVARGANTFPRRAPPGVLFSPAAVMPKPAPHGLWWFFARGLLLTAAPGHGK